MGDGGCGPPTQLDPRDVIKSREIMNDYSQLPDDELPNLMSLKEPPDDPEAEEEDDEDDGEADADDVLDQLRTSLKDSYDK